MPLQNATMYQANPEQKGYRDFSYHKDIYFKGHHHYAMYQGDQLLWTCYPDGTMPSAALDGVGDMIYEGKGINRFGYYGLRSYLDHSPSGIPSLIREAQDYSGPFYYYSMTSLNATFIKPSNTSDEPEDFVTGSIPYALVQSGTDGLLFFVPSTARSWGDNLTIFRLCRGCLTLLRPGGFDQLRFTQDTSGNASTIGQNVHVSYKTSILNGTIDSGGTALNRMAYVSYAYDGGDNRDYNYNRMALNEIRLDGSSSVLANDILRFGYLAISSVHNKHRIGLKATGLESYVDKAFVIGEHIIYLDSFGAHADKNLGSSAGLSVITYANPHQGYDTDRQEDWQTYPHLAIEDTMNLTMPFYDLNGYFLITSDWRNSIYYNGNCTYGFATQYARNETSYDSKFLLYRHRKDSAFIDNPIEINFPIATGGSMTLSYSGIQYVEPMVKREGNSEVTRFYLMGQFKVLPEDEDKADIRYYEPADESWHEVHLTQAWYFLETDANFTVLHHEWLGMVPFYSTDPVFSPWTGSFTLIHGADGESVYKIFRWSYLLGNKYYTGGNPSGVRQFISHVDFYNGGVYPSLHKPYVICWGSLSGTGELERGYIYNVTGADPDPILRDVEDLRFVPLTYEKYDMLREGWYEDENGNYHYDPDHEENSGG